MEITESDVVNVDYHVPDEVASLLPSVDCVTATAINS